MRRVILLAVVAGFLVAAAPVSAHGNYLAADHQVSDDGTVHLELVVAVTDVFAVLHMDDSGEPGAVIGNREIGEGFVHPDVAVQIEESVWTNVSGNLTIWAMLHRDTGDGSFDAADDPVVETADGEPVGSRLTVKKSAAGKVNILAEADHAQETNTSEVTVRRVELADPGYIAIYADNDGEQAQIVGHKHLEAGIHETVTVGIDDAFYHAQPERFDLWAGIHHSNGDSAFDSTDDPPVRVAGHPIATRLSLKRTDEIDHEPTEEPTTTDDGEAHDHSDGHDHDDSSDDQQSHDETSTPTPTPTASPTIQPDSTPTPGQPGFGVVSTLLAVMIAGLAAKHTRR